ncbi:MAG: NAD(P)/FAD-dependent oxidoreductase [Phreatobacter sp.]|uniref:flavin-containing monooxygenase n=1 Tax=Phreatobacter sp. TaxID=1966341 RepID=UPI001A5D8AA8|nr:NAD(P)/FAD-dependent oxidoreductase [Phreatobacter sp.]MBL8571096.1 NAD(P)/FAD-dependent oxidoreductase [Phreatobacter sp.]
MTDAARRPPTAPDSPEHVDVLIVGAGVSGIGSAWQLQKRLPDARFVVLETLGTFGGTWVTHRYPGIRSDSDLHTYGYSFKPWTGPPIATAAEIKAYMGEIIAEAGLDSHIRYHHRVVSADWSSAEKRWTVIAERLDTGESVRFTAGFLWMCQGYYRHDEGYAPEWPGMDEFGGSIVHPQTWPEELDVTAKRVVVIGSGATAATLLPAIAGKCAHVTMLQRSPTYFRTGRNAIDLAETLRELAIDEAWIHEIVRRKILFDQDAFTRQTFAKPDKVKAELIGAIRTIMGPDYDVDAHFTPRYRPWRQRIAFVPDADLFEAVKRGEASVVTDTIDRFTPTGIRLGSGDELEADVVVTATGFHLSVMGDIPFSVDGKAVDFADTVTYRGMMFTGVPNLVWVFGYFRASWTLRTDLVADFVCRLLPHMQAKGVSAVEAALRPDEAGAPRMPWVDEENFNPGYLQRGMHLLPKAGPGPDWQHSQDYWADKDAFPAIDLGDPVFVYR